MTAVLAVIGDLHFNRVDPDACAALLADLRARPLELIVVAGDLTQRARRAEFRAARAFLSALPAPVMTIPGNHDLPLFDLPRRLLRPYARFRRYIGAELEPTIQTPAVGALGVDATGRFQHKDGRLDAPRIERASRRLRAIASRPFRLVAVHQPLAAAWPEDRKHVADGAERALSAWLAAGADLVVGGHVHRGYCLEVGTARHGIVVQVGTAVSTRRRHGLANSYFQIELQADAGEARRMRLVQRDHDPSARAFRTQAAWDAVSGERGWSLRPAAVPEEA